MRCLCNNKLFYRTGALFSLCEVHASMNSDLIKNMRCARVIKRYSLKRNFKNNNDLVNTKQCLINSLIISYKYCYQILTESTSELKCCDMWENKLNTRLTWKIILSKVYGIEDMKLKWVQCRNNSTCIFFGNESEI